MSMKLLDLRKQIDEIDQNLLTLFRERLAVVKQVAIVKKETNQPTYDAQREKEKLSQTQERLNQPELWPFDEKFLKALMDIAKEYQSTC